MSDYEVGFSEDAIEDLAKLPKEIARRIRTKIDWLAQNADVLPHEAMKGDWAGAYRIKIVPYRVIYTLDKENQQIIILKIGHRKDVYD